MIEQIFFWAWVALAQGGAPAHSQLAAPQDQRTPTAPLVYTIPFREIDGLILLDVRVNGKPARLMLDTGATITIFRGEAGYIAIEVAPGHLISVQAESFGKIGIINMKIAKTVGPIDGILGENFLRGFRSLRIDYRAHLVELQP